MFGKCSHKFGPVQPDGYQYCTLCGKAEPVPLAPCNHKWKTTGNITNRKEHTIGFVSVCEKCGDMKNHLLPF